MNICILTGRTTRDIDLRYGTGNKAFGNFTLAVDNGFGDNKTTSFLNCVAFGRTAESMERYVHKGEKIMIQSEAKQNDYTDKNGVKHHNVTFIVNRWEFAGGGTQNKTDSVSDSVSQNGFMPLDDDDIPFA